MVAVMLGFADPQFADQAATRQRVAHGQAFLVKVDPKPEFGSYTATQYSPEDGAPGAKA